MRVSKTWAAVLMALAITCAAILVVMSKYPAIALIPGFVAIVCVSLLHPQAARSADAAPGPGGADASAVASALNTILEGGKPDTTGLDARIASALGDVADRIDLLNAEVSEMSPSDELTSLAKEQVFNNVLWREFNRAERYKEPMSLVLVEVEKIEEIAGAHGQKEKDRLLKHVASVILQMVRETDLAARYGDDRFAIIMPQTAGKGALEFAQRLSRGVEEAHIDINGGGAAVKLAIGAASVPGEGVKTAPDLVNKAAVSLDEARSQGRDEARM